MLDHGICRKVVAGEQKIVTPQIPDDSISHDHASPRRVPRTKVEGSRWIDVWRSIMAWPATAIGRFTIAEVRFGPTGAICG